jgi:flavin reductase (DIM6/NTAB) family NADH-FMN oxidoreductase RutF
MSKISTSVSNDFCPQTLFAYGTYKEDGTPDFGLFCWLSYYWDTELGVMLCIGGEKLTKDRIHANKVLSANLVTESMLTLADYLGNTEGYNKNKMNIPIEVEKGRVLAVPVLKSSPIAFELEVSKSIPLDDGEVFLCKIRNVLAEESLLDTAKNVGERINAIAPVSTTCETYFSWDGKPLGAWGSLKNNLISES